MFLPNQIGGDVESERDITNEVLKGSKGNLHGSQKENPWHRSSNSTLPDVKQDDNNIRVINRKDSDHYIPTTQIGRDSQIGELKNEAKSPQHMSDDNHSEESTGLRRTSLANPQNLPHKERIRAFGEEITPSLHKKSNSQSRSEVKLDSERQLSSSRRKEDRKTPRESQRGTSRSQLHKKRGREGLPYLFGLRRKCYPGQADSALQMYGIYEMDS